jgi:hypothetical protein
MGAPINSTRNLHSGQIATSNSPFSFFLLVLNKLFSPIIAGLENKANMLEGRASQTLIPWRCLPSDGYRYTVFG